MENLEIFPLRESVTDTVGEVPLTAEQEEHNIQVVLAQTAKDATDRKVARATLKSVAQSENQRDGRRRALPTILCTGSTCTTRV